MSALRTALGDYLRLRRALGHKLDEHERQLTRFVARLDAAGASFVSMADTLAFVLDPELDPTSSRPAKRLMAVRGFTCYLSAIDPRTEVPPVGLVCYRPSRRIPYLFSDDDVAAVVRAARTSTPFAFRAQTLASLIVLLAVTGLRVGEALRLDCRDVDWDQAVIKVRDTKFGKGRDVVVAASTVEALAAYSRSRDSRRPATARLFVSRSHGRVRRRPSVGPPGTTRTGPGSVSLIPVGAAIDGLELRVLDEHGDNVLDRIAPTGQQVSTGATCEGRRVSATDASGVLTVEALFGFGEDKMNLTVSGWAGVPIRNALPVAALLATATAGRRFALGLDAGPEVARYDPVSGLIGPIEDTLGWLAVLGVIQQHTLHTVVVPPDLPRSQVLEAVRAAAMLEGGHWEAGTRPLRPK